VTEKGGAGRCFDAMKLERPLRWENTKLLIVKRQRNK
jgi:hypothetical protein